jgi:hypothetical protein
MCCWHSLSTEDRTVSQKAFYSKEKLRKAYPRVDEFFSAKKKYDAEELFSNKFYEKYGK